MLFLIMEIIILKVAQGYFNGAECQGQEKGILHISILRTTPDKTGVWVAKWLVGLHVMRRSRRFESGRIKHSYVAV